MILFAISTDPMNIRYVIPVLHSQQAQTILTFFLVFLFNQSIGFFEGNRRGSPYCDFIKISKSTE
jgi:hypothetical protein